MSLKTNNIKLVRVRDWKYIEVLLPFFTPDGNFSREIIAAELALRMISNPSDVCIVVAMRGEDVVGFTSAVTLQNRDYAWSPQSWSRAEHYTDSVQTFNILCSWARTKGLRAIRFETHIKPKLLERKFGCKLHSYVMEKELYNDNESGANNEI